MTIDRNQASARLPKRIEDDPHAEAIAAALEARRVALWRGGSLQVPVVDLSDRLARTLRGAHMARRLTRGLESIEAKLAAESRGLEQADRRAGAERGVRVSRLLLLADDGAERMYRRVESLERQHGGRVLVVRLDADSTRLGAVLAADGRTAKALMVDHKDAVADALLALADPRTGEAGAAG